jgi:TRAP-type C4-dicarboxylate transport system substrate-binding protein
MIRSSGNSSATAAPRPTRARVLAGTASAFASIAFVRAPARAAQYNFKWGHATQLNHPLHVNAVRVKNEVAKRSGGRLAIQIFPANTLGGDPAMLQQSRTGALELYAGYGGIFASVAPLAGIEGIGFAFKNQAQALAAFDGALGAAVRKEMDAKGWVTFERPWVNGFRQITTSTKPIRVVADLEGLKIRTPPTKIWVDMFKELGAARRPSRRARCTRRCRRTSSMRRRTRSPSSRRTVCSRCKSTSR